MLIFIGSQLFDVPFVSWVWGKEMFSYKPDEFYELNQKSHELAKKIGWLNPAQTNKMYQLILTSHVHMLMNNMGEEGTYAAYIKALPSQELTQSVYWPREILIKIDSGNIIEEYKRALSISMIIAKEFKNFEHSKYDINAWNWSFNIVSSRMCILNNSDEAYQNDPNYKVFISPIAEYLNHSNEPNWKLEISKRIIRDLEVPVIEWMAIKDIPIGEQLMVSYGNLSNMHLLQKYGFTLLNNEYTNVPFYPNWGIEKGILNEEIELKIKLYDKTKIKAHNITWHFYENKLDAMLLPSLRIAFLNSDLVSKIGFENLWNKENFLKPIDDSQESLILEWLLRNMRTAYGLVKNKNYKELLDGTIPIDSLNKLHMFNIYNTVKAFIVTPSWNARNFGH